MGNPIEFVAPAAPTGLAAAARQLSIPLTWNANAESDLAAYNVLRAATAGGPYELVARGLTTNAFTDRTANVPQTFHYVVQAADRSLNRSAYSPEVSATPLGGPALVARYSLDGNVADSSGNANHLVPVNAPAFLAGQFGSALNFTGGQFALLPATLMTGVSDFTITMWVYWGGGSAWQRIFDFGNGDREYMFLTPSSDSGTLRFAITTNSFGDEQMLQTTPLPVNQWRHVAVTRNGNTVRLYTNGVVAATAVHTLSPASFTPVANYLGASQFANDPLFNGRLDEVFIYNYALSDAEIVRLTTNQPPPPTIPTTLSATVAGNTLNFSWPLEYFGCRLESNSLSVVESGAWFPVAGSALTNQMAMPINASSSNVFFRLVYP